MIAIQEAKRKVYEVLEKLGAQAGLKLSIIEEETLDFEFGWLFFYQSEKFLTTGDINDMVGGNAPIIVDKFNSSVHLTGTRMDSSFYIEKYRANRGSSDSFQRSIK